jgi:hypothetical protein
MDPVAWKSRDLCPRGAYPKPQLATMAGLSGLKPSENSTPPSQSKRKTFYSHVILFGQGRMLCALELRRPLGGTLFPLAICLSVGNLFSGPLFIPFLLGVIRCGREFFLFAMNFSFICVKNFFKKKNRNLHTKPTLVVNS